MSIVPVRTSRDIVLRHNDAVVVFDRDSRQLVLYDALHGGEVDLRGDCPFCHRPMRDESPSSSDRRHSPENARSGFVNPQYFRMLDTSLPPSEAHSVHPSRAASPRRSELSGGSFAADREFEQPPPSPSGISAAAFSPNYFKRFFVEERELGRGGKAVVLLVKHVLDGVELGHFACKRVPVGDDHTWLEKVLIEVQLLQNLTHPNLVSYRHVWLENAKLNTFGPSVPCAFILQQYCNAGDLHQYIYGNAPSMSTAQQLKARMRRRSRGQTEMPARAPRQLTFEEIYSFFSDITQGLRFLHSNGYIHRDLKPSNCLLHKTGNELRVLVSDFGEMQYETAVRSSTGTTGTISYCAPEVLRRVAPDGPFANFTYKSDVFSLGMILHFLCFDNLPYANANIAEEEKEDVDLLREEISRWGGYDQSRRLRADLPEQLYRLLTLLLSADPDKRPSADEVLGMIQAPAKAFNADGLGMPKANGARGMNGMSSINAMNGINGMHAQKNRGVFSLDTVDEQTVASPPKSRLSSQTSLNLMARGLRSPRPRRAERQASITSDTGTEDNELDGLRDGIVLRSSVVPPTNLNKDRSLAHASEQPLLLPPPRRGPRTVTLPSHTTTETMKVFILLLKVISLTQPCLPQATSPWVLYPCLLLAALDFETTELWVHILSLILHVAVFLWASFQHALCLPKDS